MNSAKPTGKTQHRDLKVRQVADACQVQPGTVLTWIKRREIAAIRLPGGQYRVAASEVDRLLHGRAEVEL